MMWDKIEGVKHDYNLEDYGCNENGFIMLSVLIYFEITVALVNIIGVLCHYYHNVFDIKIKKI